jgi:anti-sigma regulatory factor (Ser/Thr protein kinase)
VPNDYVRQVGNLDDHSMHRVSVAVRESVMNAIQDGNAEDETKRVLVEFEVYSTTQFTQLMVHVVDQGASFAPETAAAPLLPESLPRLISRGILFIRMIMNKLHFLLSFEDSTEVRMVKKLA